MSAPVIPAAASPAALESSASRAAIARVAVLGASGYSGQEFVRLSLAHPGVRVAALASREHAGRPGAELFPGVDARGADLPVIVAPDAIPSLVASGECDTVVACLPHGAWKEFTTRHAAALERAARLIDVSADFRDGEYGWAYGLPEAFRVELAQASRIANPGCYPTAATLALLPAAEAGWLAGPVMVSALSGVSGAGRSAQLRTSFAELDGGAAFYKVGTVHSHVAEMERTLARLAPTAGPACAVAFAPQLVPMSRGILLTATAPLGSPVTPAEAHERWSIRYAGEPFVRVLEPGAWPETRAVRHSNRCDLAVTTVHDGTQLLVTAAIDNLVKGAAGQAIQNLNILLGLPETTGLAVHGSPW